MLIMDNVEHKISLTIDNGLMQFVDILIDNGYWVHFKGDSKDGKKLIEIKAGD